MKLRKIKKHKKHNNKYILRIYNK